jgi:hypothetical protein
MWVEIENITYYAQIISAIIWLLATETIKSRGSWLQYYFQPSPIHDYMDGVFTVFQWFSMILSLILVGFVVLLGDQDIKCEGNSYLPIIYVVLVWEIMILAVISNTLFAEQPYGIWINKLPVLLTIGVSTICVYLYLPIHFFVINGCQSGMQAYLYACLGSLYLGPVAFML